MIFDDSDPAGSSHQQLAFHRLHPPGYWLRYPNHILRLLDLVNQNSGPRNEMVKTNT